MISNVQTRLVSLCIGFAVVVAVAMPLMNAAARIVA
jgi:hypothetical protein